MVAVALNEPSWVVTVMVAEPEAIEVTKPVSFTVATFVSLETQLTPLLVALFGLMVAVNCCVLPKPLMVAAPGDNVTPVTFTGLTVSTASPKTPDPSVAVALIVVDPDSPDVFAVTNPALLTEAIVGSEELHKTVLLLASAGNTVSVACEVAPDAIVAALSETEMEVTKVNASTVISVVSVKPPS